MKVEVLSQLNESAWDNYVIHHPESTIYHCTGWKKVIESSMGYDGTYIFAVNAGQIVGIYPLFILKTQLFGTVGASLPYVDYGGVLADSPEIIKLLTNKAEAIGRSAGCSYIELRQRLPLKIDLPVSTRKISIVIPLQREIDEVFSRLHRNVRNKIRKAHKNNVQIQTGNEYLCDFYRVYTRNLRDLGTPAKSINYFFSILDTFHEHVRVYRAIRNGKTIGAKIVLMDEKTCYFIEMASIRDYLGYAPVHALNWAAIEDACKAGCSFADMGRSTVNSTHHKFKSYWGGKIIKLQWAYQLLNCDGIPILNTDNPKYSLAITLWKKLPLFVTRYIGPPLARRLP